MAPSKENAFPALSLRPVQPGAGIDGLSIPSAFAAAPVTVVTVGFQAHSQAQLVPWTQHIVAALNPTPLPSYTPGVDSGVAFLNLVFLQGWVWKGLSGLVAGSTARALPPPVAAATALAVEPSAQTMDVSRYADHFLADQVAPCLTHSRCVSTSASHRSLLPSHSASYYTLCSTFACNCTCKTGCRVRSS